MPKSERTPKTEIRKGGPKASGAALREEKQRKNRKGVERVEVKRQP
jgi:hypothetical protein